MSHFIQTRGKEDSLTCVTVTAFVYSPLVLLVGLASVLVLA